jgi:drug/metabolite transporter (DMT)-like permease
MPLLLVAATACWGCGTVSNKQVLDRGVAPLTLLATELAASSLLLSVGTLVVGSRPTRLATLGRLAALGIHNPGFAYAPGAARSGHDRCEHVGAPLGDRTGSHHAARRALFAGACRRRDHRRRGCRPDRFCWCYTGPGASGDAIGIGLTVGAVTACAFYTVLTRRLLVDSSLAVVLMQQLAMLADTWPCPWRADHHHRACGACVIVGGRPRV